MPCRRCRKAACCGCRSKRRASCRRAASVGTVSPGEYLLLKVKDSGTGIQAEILERMFDPFFTTKEIGVGSGLGLSLVHCIVTSVGGAIDVATELGKGSTFTVYLPRSGDAPAEQAYERMPGLSGSALIREVRGIRQAIPVVLMSGYLGMRSVDADVVVRKPLSAGELAASMARVLHP